MFKRIIQITNIELITKSLTDSKDLVVKVKGDYDYRFKCSMRDELIHAI